MPSSLFEVQEQPTVELHTLCEGCSKIIMSKYSSSFFTYYFYVGNVWMDITNRPNIVMTPAIPKSLSTMSNFSFSFTTNVEWNSFSVSWSLIWTEMLKKLLKVYSFRR